MEVPLHYFEGNLLFTPDKKCWAFYEIAGFQYDFKSVETKKSYWRDLLGFFWGIDKSARLLFLPESYTFEEHFEKLKNRNSGPFVDFAMQADELSQAWLEETYESIGSNKYRVFVSLKIGEEPGFLDTIKGAKDFIVKMFKEPAQKVDRLLGLSGIEILEEEMRLYKELEDRLHTRIRKFITINRAEEADTEWVVRRNFWKGIGPPPKRFLWNKDRSQNAGADDAIRITTNRSGADVSKVNDKKYIRPRLAEFMPLMEGIVDTKHNDRMVKITQQVGNEEVSAYSAYLVMADKPDEMYIPGNEFIYQLHDLDFPVGVSMYLEPMPYMEVRDKLKGKKMDIEDQTDHTQSSRVDVPLSLQESHKEATFLEKDLDDSKFPMFDTSFVFELTAPDERTLLERVDALKDFYKNMHIELVCPAGEQWQLFNEFMPVGDRLCSVDYVHRLSPHVLAATMIAASKRLGDGTGFFIGTTGIMHMPVFFDASLAPRKNRSGSGAILGSLGGGKSFLANLLAWLSTIHGGKALIFDPKADRKDWKKDLPEFGDELEIVKLSDREQDHGKLDPWGIFDDPNEAAGVAINICTFLAHIKTDDDGFVDLSETIERVKFLPKKKRNMFAIITDLENQEATSAKQLARRFRAFSKLPFAKLLFYDGELNTIRTSRRMTVLQVDSLNLPDSSAAREDFDITQTLSIAFMMSISAFATKFAEEDPDEFTVVIMDEFWALSGTREGKKLATRLIRTGRSYFAAIIIISQNAKDLLDSSIKNNLGFKFVFQSTDKDEITDVLEFMDLEPTEENREMIKTLENGRPLFRDMDGHCGIVDIEPIFQHLEYAFNTTPGKKKKVS